ncbi:MAG: TerB family tellurite resistance protein [Rhizobiaceae bacterium]
MFDRVMQWLEADGADHERGFNTEDIRLSIAALYYHMIAVDGVVTVEELRHLRGVLREQFLLDDKQIAHLANKGEAMDKSSAGIFPFTVILNRELEEQERKEVYDQLLTLAKADGVLHSLEEAMLDHVKFLLQLP